MVERALHLVRVPFRSDALVRIARARGLPLRELDEGYLAHAILREIWQDAAPAPFSLRGNGRRLDAWGYSDHDAARLRDHAISFGDPLLLDAVDQGLEGIVSKLMPVFPEGRRIGLQVRVCPIVRLSGGRGGQRGREVDAFLARCWQEGDTVDVSRERVYLDWVAARLTEEQCGVRVEWLRIDAYKRERFVRRTQRAGRGDRMARTIERPDVQVSGNVVVANGERFLATLRHGIGRHRAFGFGMIFVVPPSGRAVSAEGENGE